MGEYVGARAQVQEVESHLGEKTLSPGELPPLWELQGEGVPSLHSTLRHVGVEVWGTRSDGSGRSLWEGPHNSLKTKIKWRANNSSSEETWQQRTALRHRWAMIKDWSYLSFMFSTMTRK